MFLQLEDKFCVQRHLLFKKETYFPSYQVSIWRNKLIYDNSYLNLNKVKHNTFYRRSDFELSHKKKKKLKH